ncbi:MAG: hypothetical protein SCH71_06520 [Desulfobulbaceae bacterium]|nr:hypothetical protein [Desulfobulbaceae bacterium]
MGISDYLVKFFSKFWSIFMEAFGWLIAGLGLLLQFVFYTIFDGLLLVIETFFSLLDLSAIAFSYSSTWAGLPSQTIWFMNEIAFPQGLTLLAGAYIIRLTLNLIPTWATRV